MELPTSISSLFDPPLEQYDEYVHMHETFRFNLTKHYRASKTHPVWRQEKIDRIIEIINSSNTPELIKQNSYYLTSYRVEKENDSVFLLKRFSDADNWLPIIAFENYYTVLWNIHFMGGHGFNNMVFLVRGNLYIPEVVVKVFTRGCRYCSPVKLNTLIPHESKYSFGNESSSKEPEQSTS